MSIDSPWGTGKTTFIKMWQAHLESQSVTSICFNAWESDYAEDPLVALVAELDRWVKSLNNPSLTEDAWNKAKSLLPGIAKSAAVATAKMVTFGGLDIEKEYEKIAANLVGGAVNNLVDSFNVQSSAIHQFKQNVEDTISALGDKQKNLLIFVDELDRCRPTYAIELLERIKHLFNIDRIVFILSTDIEQLSHSICAVYGNNFNARSYLQRFIDIDYSLKKLENTNYINSLIHSLSIDGYFKESHEKAQLQNYVEPPSLDKKVKTVKKALAEAIEQHGFDVVQMEEILSTLPKDYFLRYQVEDILWHLQLLSKASDKTIRVAQHLSGSSVVDIFVYGDDTKGLFFKLVGIIEKLGLDIVDAKILTSKDNKAYNTISVLQDEKLELIDVSQIIENELLQAPATVREVSDKYAHKHFDHTIRIAFSHNEKWNLTQLEVSAIDKQGVLSNIAHIFYQLDIYLVNARISTMGERVEDVFFISNADNKPLSKAQQKQLRQYLQENL
jgi:predicted amino acid-binding ACT domain protein